MSNRKVRLTINGREYRGDVEPRKLLTDFLRDDLGLTGTHIGCEHGVCGACTILLNDEPVRSCLLFAVQANGAAIKTIEGLAPSATELHPLQEKFWELHGLQCGFCTPGILLTAQALLNEIANPSEAEIRQWISGNLCRCTGYQNIVTAIQEAAKTLSGNKQPSAETQDAKQFPCPTSAPALNAKKT
jgi:carbon-monoxide dehydrogenase small subunit